MYEIGTLGRWEHIPQEAAAVYDKDILKLKNCSRMVGTSMIPLR